MERYLIGLTGNIACGKSTVLAELARLGAQTIDADAVVHRLQRPGEPVYAQIVAAFGAQILSAPDGPIDRRALGAIVFTDPAELRRLEQIVHPAVHEHILTWIAALPSGAVGVIDAIKLLEAGWRPHLNAVWVVTCPAEQQIARLVQTRGLTEDEAQTRVAAQPLQAEKIAAADVVIDNGGALAATLAQVRAAWAAVQETHD